MNVADAVGRTLAAAGVQQVFGVIGSGNFHLTNAMVAGGARFVAARHEGGAATMADAYSRMSGTVAAISVHQGCGLTNAMTGIAEAAKSRTPMIVVAAEATEPRSNFYVDQGRARSCGRCRAGADHLGGDGGGGSTRRGADGRARTSYGAAECPAIRAVVDRRGVGSGATEVGRRGAGHR